MNAAPWSALTVYYHYYCFHILVNESGETQGSQNKNCVWEAGKKGHFGIINI
jgi:hypothetical protein